MRERNFYFPEKKKRSIVSKMNKTCPVHFTCAYTLAKQTQSSSSSILVCDGASSSFTQSESLEDVLCVDSGLAHRRFFFLFSGLPRSCLHTYISKAMTRAGLTGCSLEGYNLWLCGIGDLIAQKSHSDSISGHM